jgi:hypothetical protein
MRFISMTNQEKYRIHLREDMKHLVEVVYEYLPVYNQLWHQEVLTESEEKELNGMVNLFNKLEEMSTQLQQFLLSGNFVSVMVKVYAAFKAAKDPWDKHAMKLYEGLKVKHKLLITEWEQEVLN